MKDNNNWTSNDNENNTDNQDNSNQSTPWKRLRKSSYEDLILKPEYEHLRMKFPLGKTWFRICPAFARSPYSWMLGVFAINYEGGRFAHPKTHKPNARSVFDHAYSWCAENAPASLFSKTNKEGVRLLPDPLSICWILVEVEGKLVPRLLIASGYDGSRGGVAGIGYQLWSAVREIDETGARICDPIDPGAGRQIMIEKTQAAGVKYPTYKLTVGRLPAPMDELTAKLDPNDLEAMVPIEEVVRELDEETEWRCLEKVIAPKTVETIRSGLKR